MIVNKWALIGLCAGLVCFAGAAYSSPAVGTAAATTQDGVYTQVQAIRGKKTYVEKCSSCHLTSLAGGVNESPALKGDEFASHWSGKPLRELYSRIISTMPLSDPGTLSEKETLDVVAFILQGNGFPPGKAGLQSPSQLSKIQFRAAK